MKQFKVITDCNNEFVALISESTNIEKWAKNWIEKDDQDIEFWSGGNISFDRLNNEINIFGDNGLITLNVKNVTIE